MRYLAVLMLVAVSVALGGCAPKICKAADTYWTGCLGEKKYSDPEHGDVTFSGKWEDNSPNGQGTLTDDNGDTYVGEVKDGLPNGQGTFTENKGSKYESKFVGEWKDGDPHGQVTEYRADGSVKRKGWWCKGKESNGPCPD